LSVNVSYRIYLMSCCPRVRPLAFVSFLARDSAICCRPSVRPSLCLPVSQAGIS